MLTFYDNYTNVAIGLMKSTIYNTSKELCFIVMTKSLNENSIAELRNAGTTIIIYYVNKDLFKYTNSNWPIDSIFRLITPWIVEEKMDYLYYLDADMICINNMDDLYETKFNESIALCPETSVCSTKVCSKFGGDLVYCNLGLLIYNITKIKSRYTMDSLLNELNCMSNDLYFPDQDFINLYHNNGCLHLNPFKYNNQTYDFHNKHLVEQFLSNGIFVRFCVVKGKHWNKISTFTRYNICLKYSRNAYMKKNVSKCKCAYLIRAPFYKIYSICYRMARKVYKIVFRTNKRIINAGGVTLNLEFIYSKDFRLPQLQITGGNLI